MRRWTSLAVLSLLAGCGSNAAGIAGTYHADSGLHEIILGGNGTYRMMYGERTSPADKKGTYRKDGDSLIFAPESPDSTLPAGKIVEGGFTIGQERYRKN
jgi:hypothetical protein